MDYNQPSLHAPYDKGRTQSPETVALWMDAVAEFLTPLGTDLTVLDLGCGTGRYSVHLAEHLGATVIGVEPADGMREQAVANRAHPRVTYLAGRAEDIPCPDESFDGAFLSMMVHHVTDVPAMCRQLHRVLRPGGRVFLRNSFSGRLDSVVFYSFFPAGKEIDEDRLPNLGQLCNTFAEAGFELVAHRVVTQQIDPDLSSHYRRLRHRAASTFELMSEADVRKGFEAMEAAIRDGTHPGPVLEDIDLLVFAKPAGSRD